MNIYLDAVSVHFCDLLVACFTMMMLSLINPGENQLEIMTLAFIHRV